MSNKKIILGIDPGLVNTGWGVVFRDGTEVGYINCGVIQTKADDAMEKRLCHIFDKISLAIVFFLKVIVPEKEIIPPQSTIFFACSYVISL